MSRAKVTQRTNGWRETRPNTSEHIQTHPNTTPIPISLEQHPGFHTARCKHDSYFFWQPRCIRAPSVWRFLRRDARMPDSSGRQLQYHSGFCIFNGNNRFSGTVWKTASRRLENKLWIQYDSMIQHVIKSSRIQPFSTETIWNPWWLRWLGDPPWRPVTEETSGGRLLPRSAPTLASLSSVRTQLAKRPPSSAPRQWNTMGLSENGLPSGKLT